MKQSFLWCLKVIGKFVLDIYYLLNLYKLDIVLAFFKILLLWEENELLEIKRELF